MKPRLTVATGSLAFVLVLSLAPSLHAQQGTRMPAIPLNGVTTETQAGNGVGIPINARTQGTTDRKGSEQGVRIGPSGAQPMGGIIGINVRRPGRAEVSTQRIFRSLSPRRPW